MLLLALRIILIFSVIFINFEYVKPQNQNTILHLLEDAQSVTGNENDELENFHRLYDIMAQVQLLQPKTLFLEQSEHERLKHLPLLQEYCASRLHGVEIEDTDGFGFGLRATENIPKNRLINAIPVEETISYLNALQYFEDVPGLTDIIGFAEDNENDLWQTHVWMAIFIISEQQNPNSNHTFAINALPRKIDHPVYFNAAELKYLDGGQALSGTVMRYNVIVHHYISLYRFLSENPVKAESVRLSADILTYEFFQWAFTVVLTRCYEDEHNMLVIQCFDMVNHAFPGNADTQVSYNIKAIPMGIGGDAYLWATDDIKKGDEITFSYNPRSSTIDHFFDVWGIPEKNASIFLQAILEPDDPHLGQKTIFSRDLDLAQEPQKLMEIKLDLEEEFLMPAQYFPSLILLGSNVTPSETVSQQVWIQIWAKLVKLVDDQLHRYTYPLSNCTNLLEKTNLSKLSRLSISQTINEQEFLERIKERADYLSKTRVQTVAWEAFYKTALQRRRNRSQPKVNAKTEL